jgi:uncharacterized protein YegL
MKKNLTEMVFILDRSGSMGNLVADTIGGFNSMIEQQKKEDGEAYVTTVLFNSHHTTLHDHVNIQDVQPITTNEYCTYGMTALLDAVGTTINSIGERLADTPEEERPEKVIFVITTDGYENDSREFTRDKVKEMIEHQQEKYSWVFMFLGANMDAVEEAGKYGISSHYAATYTASDLGTTSLYACTSKAVSNLRNIDTACTMDWMAQAACSVEEAFEGIC